jgi:hypothetical protein
MCSPAKTLSMTGRFKIMDESHFECIHKMALALEMEVLVGQAGMCRGQLCIVLPLLPTSWRQAFICMYIDLAVYSTGNHSKYSKLL